MKCSNLEGFIRENLNEVEKNHSYEVGTETVRVWIDLFNEEKSKNMKGNFRVLHEAANPMSEEITYILENEDCNEKALILTVRKQSLDFTEEVMDFFYGKKFKDIEVIKKFGKVETMRGLQELNKD